MKSNVRPCSSAVRKIMQEMCIRDRADAMQDTILDAFEHIRELKKAEFFKTWLVRILINNCNRMYNQNKKKGWAIDEIPEMISPDRVADVEFHQMLNSLPEDSRLIFLLHYGEQFTTREDVYKRQLLQRAKAQQTRAI